MIKIEILTSLRDKVIKNKDVNSKDFKKLNTLTKKFCKQVSQNNIQCDNDTKEIIHSIFPLLLMA